MRRTEEWGDERVELDASAAVAEAQAKGEDTRTAGLWYFIRRSGKRIAVAAGGFGLVVLGLILVPLPGPGWAIVFGGLALLATEFVWAERLLGFAKRNAAKGFDAAIGKPGRRNWYAVAAITAALVAPTASLVSSVLDPPGAIPDAIGWSSLALAVAAIVLGHLGLMRQRRRDTGPQGRWLSWAALLISYPTAIVLSVQLLG